VGAGGGCKWLGIVSSGVESSGYGTTALLILIRGHNSRDGRGKMEGCSLRA
jgi:hypothetical protein